MQPDHPVWDCDCVEDSSFQVADEHIRTPHSVKLVVIEGDSVVGELFIDQSLIMPLLAQVQGHRELLKVISKGQSHTIMY